MPANQPPSLNLIDLSVHDRALLDLLCEDIEGALNASLSDDHPQHLAITHMGVGHIRLYQLDTDRFYDLYLVPHSRQEKPKD